MSKNTGFNAQIGGGRYAIQFETEHRDLYNVVRDACYKVMDIVGGKEPEAAPTIKSCWISVDDRLPELDECVLVFVTSGLDASGHVRICNSIQIGCYFDEGLWEIDFGGVNEVTVSHWMPLPKDPRGL